MKLATGSINSKRSILLSILTVLMFGILSPLLSVATVIAAPPDSLTVNGEECKLVMSSTATKNLTRGDFATYNITALPQSVMDGIDANPEIKADYEYYANANALTVPAILYDAVVAGNGDPQTKCREAPSVMYMSPSNPTKFFGTQIGNEILLTGTLNVAAKTFTFDATNDGTYKIGGDLSNPIFQQTTTSVGFCAVEAQVGPGVYASCMQPNVVDFNTISWRGETYILQSWSGNQTTRMEYVLDKSTSPYTNRKNSTCTTKSMFRIDGDNADSIEELTTDGDNGISGFFGQLGTLATLSGSQTIQYRDYDGLCSPIHEGDDDDIELFNAQNFLRLAQYFAKDNAVAIIPKNPGGGEKSMSQVYTKSATDPTLFVAPEGAKSGDCVLTAESSTIKFTSDPSTGSGAYLDAYWSFPDPDNSCSPLGANIKVKFTPADSAETIDQAANGGTDGGTDTAAVPEKTCSSEGAGLGWIICPVLEVLDAVTVRLENIIQGFLFVDAEQFNKDGQGANLYKSWSTFRGLATIVIVIIALMMIFSQAMGEGVFNNYSVKKLLPRLIIAGIGIQLSWFLITELINIFNILGNGISGLIMSPFEVSPGVALTTKTPLSEVLPTFDGGGLMVGLVIAGGVGLIGAVGALAIGAAAAIFVGFITLIVRNIVIFLGVVFAPIAIAMSVLPGTQKSSKWWWESLSKALMMYPLVMVLLAAGKIVAVILMRSAPVEADGSVGDLSLTTTLAAIIAWYAPYFFLPKALQAGGSALGKVTGLAGDKSKGMFDKARGFNDSYKKSKGARRQREAFDPNASGFKKFRTSGTRAGVYLGAGAIGRGSKFEREDLRAKGSQELAGIKAREDYATRTGGGSLAVDQAEVQAAKALAASKGFDIDAAKAGIELQEAEIAIKNAEARLSAKLGSSGMVSTGGYTGPPGARVYTPGALEAEFHAAAAGEEGNATRTAVLNRLAVLGKDQAIRDLETSDGGANATLFSDVKNTASFQGAMKDKAPDLTKGGTAGAYSKLPKAEKMSDWSADSLRLALEHNGGQNVQEILELAEKDPDFAATLDKEKTQVLNDALHAASGGTGTHPPGAPDLFTKAKKAVGP